MLNDTMLFVFGNWVVDYLTGQDLDRAAAFYREVQNAREDKLSGPGPDQSSVAEADQPTADELKAYENTSIG